MSDTRHFTYFCGDRGHWWFRVRGWGLFLKDSRRHHVLFSERYAGEHGLAKRHVRIGRWLVGVLTPRH